MVEIKNLHLLEDHEEWQHAEDLYRSGNPHKLIKMLRSNQAMPRLQRTFLAEILAGNVKLPKMTGKKNAKLTYEQREVIHNVLKNVPSMLRLNRKDRDWLADEMKIEVADLRKLMARVRENSIAALAQHYGIRKASVPTIAQRFRPVPRQNSVFLKGVSKKRQ